MGNFAEKLNLGNRFRPPPLLIESLFYYTLYLRFLIVQAKLLIEGAQGYCFGIDTVTHEAVASSLQ